ncbi:MAG: hypothetical protein H9855_13455, partial [Candidatus Acinetobacter avistercoris]|nr:hypothetical protein [Candidatus Acinetobacter avistercoris]
ALIRLVSTFNIQHSTFNIQHSTFNIQHSTFNIQHSTFNIQHSHNTLIMNNLSTLPSPKGEGIFTDQCIATQ